MPRFFLLCFFLLRSSLLCWLLLALICDGARIAQAAPLGTLVSCRKAGTLTAARFNERYKAVYGRPASSPATHAVGLYVLHYMSSDAHGKPVTLSGLLALPDGGAQRGLALFNHGTMADRRLSPSRYDGGAKTPEAEAAVLAFASGGYAVALPDYLGLGDNPGTHPYPLGKVNCRSAIDILGPARLAARRLGVPVGPRLFVTGYSEGGAVALWTVRQMEASAGSIGSPIDAAAGLSGPYDLSGATVESLEAPTTSQALFAARLYLLAYLLHSARQESAIRLTDYVVPTMALAISRVFDRGLTEDAIIKRLVVVATLRGAKNSVSRITTRRFQDILKRRDFGDPVLRALKENDCYDWSPRTPLLLVYLRHDGIVVPANTQSAVSAMRVRGIGPKNLQTAALSDTKMNHSTAIVPALAEARRYFDRRQ